MSRGREAREKFHLKIVYEQGALVLWQGFFFVVRKSIESRDRKVSEREDKTFHGDEGLRGWKQSGARARAS